MPFRNSLAALTALFGAAFALLSVAAPASALEEQSLTVDGLERSYLLAVPDGYRARAALPLVIVLHGAGTTARYAAQITGFDDKAEQEGFIAAFPNGTGPWVLQTWNAEHCCGTAMDNGVDDIGFISALIDRLLAGYPIDPGRVYVTGFSNGAMLTHRVGIELSDKVAAIAPVAGGLFGGEPMPANPVPVLFVNSVEDRVIPPDGKQPTVDGPMLGVWDGRPLLPSDYQATYWSAANHCNPASIVTAGDHYRMERYVCPVGAAVEYYLVDDNRHAWPGERDRVTGNLINEDFNATSIIWDFLRRYRREMPLADAGADAGGAQADCALSCIIDETSSAPGEPINLLPAPADPGRVPSQGMPANPLPPLPAE